MRTVQIVPYDQTWPEQFLIESEYVKHALGSNCIVIYHIGSTAVPGLASKPVIDLMPVVLDINAVDLCNEAMEILDYTARGEDGIPLRRYFRKGSHIRTHHVHVFEQGNPQIDRHLRFRNWMRNNAEDRQAYENLKRRLAAQFSNDISAYCEGKNEFIASIDKKAMQCVFAYHDLTTKELSAVKNFRNTYFFGPHGIDDPYTWTFNHKEHAHLVLYQGVDIIGYAHIQFWPDKRAAIRIIVIDENKRNQNIGSTFLTLIEKWLKSLDVKSVHAESRPSSLGFYSKKGYIEILFNDPNGDECGPPDISVGKFL